MGDGLKRVARLCGGLTATDARMGETVHYDEKGRRMSDNTPRRPSALQSLMDRFIGDDPEKLAEYERAKAEMAREDAEELAAEIDRLTAEVAECRADARKILDNLRRRKGTEGEGKMAIADIVALKRIAGKAATP